MTGQPVHGGRQSTGQHKLALVSKLDHRTQKWMVRPAESGSADVGGWGGMHPVGAVLERVGGKGGDARIGVKGPPGRAMAMVVQLGYRGGDGV